MDPALAPYIDWYTFYQNIKHPESIVNFIAAYGTHPDIAAATSDAEKRQLAAKMIIGYEAALAALASGGSVNAALLAEGAPVDTLDFLTGQVV
jgi:hypothetical protein